MGNVWKVRMMYIYMYLPGIKKKLLVNDVCSEHLLKSKAYIKYVSNFNNTLLEKTPPFS